MQRLTDRVFREILSVIDCQLVQKDLDNMCLWCERVVIKRARSGNRTAPCATFMCVLHTLQYANVGLLSLWHINCKSVAHSGLYFAAYFFFFAELAYGESDPCFAILLFPCNKHRIRRFITLRTQNMWGKTANQKRYKAASPDTFTETEHKKCA